MKVERLYTRDIVGIPRSASVQEAAAMMRKFHVGALMVVESAEPKAPIAGIVSDRDLVLQVLAEGLDARRTRVEKVMSPIVASVAEEADLHEALECMRAAGIRRLLVTRADGSPAGIVSMDDVVEGLVAELTSLAALLKNEARREASEYSQPRAAA